MPERSKVVCIPCKALYKCSAFNHGGSSPLCYDLALRDVHVPYKPHSTNFNKWHTAV